MNRVRQHHHLDESTLANWHILATRIIYHGSKQGKQSGLQIVWNMRRGIECAIVVNEGVTVARKYPRKKKI